MLILENNGEMNANNNGKQVENAKLAWNTNVSRACASLDRKMFATLRSLTLIVLTINKVSIV